MEQLVFFPLFLFHTVETNASQAATSVLSAAAEGGHVNVVTYLLSLEADINGAGEVRNCKFTLFFFAVFLFSSLLTILIHIFFVS